MLKIDERMSSDFILKFLMEQEEIKSDGEQLFLFDGKCWKRIPPCKEGIEIRRFFTPDSQAHLSSRRLGEILRTLKETIAESDIFQSGRGYIVFENGVYNLKKQQIVAGFDLLETPVEAVVNANYIPKAKIEMAPTFLGFAKSSLEYDKSPKKTELLLQILGYVFSDRCEAKKAFFLLGEQSSGKSVILRFVGEMLGEENVTQIPFGKLGDRFAGGALQYSRANLCAELSEGKFPKIDVFKAITGGDVIAGENKGKNQFFYRPQTKLLNAGNVMPVPKNSDGTRAITERLIFLIFKQSVNREDWNLNLFDDLCSEKDIICSMAVDTLKELVESNFAFETPDDSQQHLQIYADSLNAVQVFLREECWIGEGAIISSVELWETFKQFCTNNCFPASVTQQNFVSIVSGISGVSKRRMRKDGRQQTFYEGIELVGQDPEIIVNPEDGAFYE